MWRTTKKCMCTWHLTHVFHIVLAWRELNWKLELSNLFDWWFCNFQKRRLKLKKTLCCTLLILKEWCSQISGTESEFRAPLYMSYLRRRYRLSFFLLCLSLCFWMWWRWWYSFMFPLGHFVFRIKRLVEYGFILVTFSWTSSRFCYKRVTRLFCRGIHCHRFSLLELPASRMGRFFVRSGNPLLKLVRPSPGLVVVGAGSRRRSTSSRIFARNRRHRILPIGIHNAVFLKLPATSLWVMARV